MKYSSKRSEADKGKLVEAALFMTPKPLQEADLSKIAGIASLDELAGILAGLEKEYSERGVRVTKTPEGWEMHVAPDMLNFVAHLAPYSNLSEGCKRALALAVYKEPLEQSELIRIQGNKAYAYVEKLEKAGLIRTEKAGRTWKLYLTTEFENYFGDQKDNIKKQLEEQYGKYKEREEKRKLGKRE